jgi:hypothetical protein
MSQRFHVTLDIEYFPMVSRKIKRRVISSIEEKLRTLSPKQTFVEPALLTKYRKAISFQTLWLSVSMKKILLNIKFI